MNTFKTLQEKYKELDMRLDICINSNSYGFDICLYDNKTGRFATCIEVDEEDVIAFTDELYKKLRPEYEIDAMFNFGVALTYLRNGLKVARKGWNGKGMAVAYRNGYIGIPANESTAKAWGMEEGEPFDCRPYLQLRCADGTYQMWTASQSDLLADDWYIAE